MYGGKGICPYCSSSSSTVLSCSNFSSKSASWRASMVIFTWPSNSNSAPALGARLARTCASTLWSSSSRSTRTSTLPPDTFSPSKRAGITRVSLNTNKSPAFISSTIFLKCLCSMLFSLAFTESNLLALRCSCG